MASLTPSPLDFELNASPDEIRAKFASLKGRHSVADLLEVPYMHLVHILYRSPQRYAYTKFSIPKRSGGVREIAAPANSLKILQAKLNSVLQIVYKSKPAAHGFISGHSIVTNALAHTGKRFVLNLDLEDFFPSIHFGRIRGAFMGQPYNVSAAAATVLAQICSTPDGLPQGAPSSPMVSNLVCARLDGELQRLAKKHRCTYTRYADDISFSTTAPRFPPALASRKGDGWAPGEVELGRELAEVIEANDFRVNARKTRMQVRECHQEVTGLTVNKFPNVQRRFVRQVRAMLHAWKSTV